MRPTRGRSMSKHRKSSGDKSSSDKKQKSNGKRELKKKTMAAEIGGALMREEAPKPEPRPAAEVAKPALVPLRRRRNLCRAQLRPARRRQRLCVAIPAAAKPAPRPVLEAAKPAPRPVQPAVSQAPARKKPLEPRSRTNRLPRLRPRRAEPKAGESAAVSWQRSFDAARLVTVEVNGPAARFRPAHIASGTRPRPSNGTDADRGGAAPARLLRRAHEDDAHQAEAIRALSVDLVARANEPIREQLRMKRMTAWWG